jgi:hypothetical protein
VCPCSLSCFALALDVKFVALCVHVGWSSHRAGGSDVVEFPEVLHDPEQYLDMFDSESDFSGCHDLGGALFYVVTRHLGQP